MSPPIEVLLIPLGIIILSSGGAPTALYNVSDIGLVTLDCDSLLVETHTYRMCLIHIYVTQSPLAPCVVNTPQIPV